ncbi:MAG TPA: hypothetical protein VM223_08255 [Planctomycetota bacterium]|nr:hypothetical protein [Planctomycetota bacterium]
MGRNQILYSVVMPAFFSAFFEVLVFVEVCLAIGGMGCGVWGTITQKPLGLAVLVASAAAAAAGVAFYLVSSRLKVSPEPAASYLPRPSAN